MARGIIKELHRMGETKTPETPQTAPPTGPATLPDAPKAAGGGMPDYVRFPLVLGIVAGIAAIGLAVVYGLTKQKIDEGELRTVNGSFESVLGAAFARAEKKFTGGTAYYELADAGGKRVAYAVQVSCAGSYNGGEPVKLMVITDEAVARILGVRVIASKETPGFGERINDPIAANSLVGMVLGSPARSRVVLTSSGAVVGTVRKADDGSLVIARPATGELKVAPDDVVATTEAPFPSAFIDQFTGVPVGEAALGKRIDAISGATITSRAVAGGVAAAIGQLEAAVGSR
jgi:Na+-translocating ferredoxin:NAD+ oxidoreductase RnfG subunit